MATSFSLTHHFDNISLEKFERYLNHPDLNKLLEKKLNNKRVLVKQTQEGDKITWVFDVKKKVSLPDALKKVLKSDFISWQETSTFAPKEHVIYWSITPSIDVKFTGEGKYVMEGSGSGCSRTIEGSICVKVPLIGKLVESFIVSELKKNYDLEPLVQKQFYQAQK